VAIKRFVSFTKVNQSNNDLCFSRNRPRDKRILKKCLKEQGDSDAFTIAP